MAKSSYSNEQKEFLLQRINENKDVLFGAFDESTSRDEKRKVWESIFDSAIKTGLPFPKEANYAYLRDTFWPNTKRATLVSYYFIHVRKLIVHTQYHNFVEKEG